MDTMVSKHIRCFGPCMIREWHLEEWEEELLTRWNQINLYTMTRGINRFKGLAMILREINAEKQPIEGIHEFSKWTETTPELSNRAVDEAFRHNGIRIFAKALSWSKAVNSAIDAMPEDEKLPFAGVAQALDYAHRGADVAIVSSANREAVEEEWTKHGLTKSVDLILCQDDGSKAYCIKALVDKGYDPTHVLMVGDAPGDLDAASAAGVYFYPILAGHETDSWEQISQAIDLLQSDRYEAYGESAKAQFIDNLKGQ